ncbi:MAG: MFS transporter [Actinobacteria bacterium]|nr:MFS transporter [Actinomycetota bacterium]
MSTWRRREEVSTSSADTGGVPPRAGLALAALILGALVCNINLAVANVALPDIGRALASTQTELTLVAVGCTLGLAMSVLYLGAVGDRYGRKMLLLTGLGLTIPASAVSAWAPSTEVLVAGRIFTGIAAGMAYPTTLALITALWGEGPKRVRAIALWSAVSAGGAVVGPVLAGLLLQDFWWGSVFLIAVPLAVIGFVLVLVAVPAHVNESTKAVDHFGGSLSVVMIAALVLGIGIISAPGKLTASLSLLAIAAVLIIIFAWHELRARNPIYDLHYARRRLFWVPAVAGMITFGSLVGSMFVGQQFLQNVLGYSTLDAGTAILPAAVGMVLVAPLSARLVVRIGSRDTLLLGYAFILPAFIVMLVTWGEGTSYAWVGLGYLLVGIGAGLALTPAARSLTGSVPVTRVGMASGTADLQRDLGGSIMQALLGALLTIGYSTAFTSQIDSSPAADEVSEATQSALTQSYSSAASLAERYPEYSEQIINAARKSFVDGANWAYAAGGIAVVIGAIIVAVVYPGLRGEKALISEYGTADAAVDDAARATPPTAGA